MCSFTFKAYEAEQERLEKEVEALDSQLGGDTGAEPEDEEEVSSGDAWVVLCSVIVVLAIVLFCVLLRVHPYDAFTHNCIVYCCIETRH